MSTIINSNRKFREMCGCTDNKSKLKASKPVCPVKIEKANPPKAPASADNLPKASTGNPLATRIGGKSRRRIRRNRATKRKTRRINRRRSRSRH